MDNENKNKIIVIGYLVVVTIISIFLAIYSFKLGTLLGLFLIVALLSLVIPGIFLFKSITKSKIFICFILGFIGISLYLGYFISYSKTEEYRINKIDYLYSKIYTKVNTTKGKGWVEYWYTDIYGNEEKAYYYDGDKNSVDTNSNIMMEKIESLRKDLPTITNIKYDSYGNFTWDPINIDHRIEYTIFVDGIEKDVVYDNNFKLSIKDSNYEIKIVASESVPRYFNQSEASINANFNIVTVTVIDPYGRERNIKMPKGLEFDYIKNYYTNNSLYSDKLYYDNDCTREFINNTKINYDITLYEGALDYYIDVLGYLDAVNPRLEGEFIVPDGVKRIDAGAFKNCDKITKVTLNGKYNCISSRSFNNLKNLKEVIINGSVSEIEKEAFYNCDNLQIVYFSSSVYLSDVNKNFIVKSNSINDVIILGSDSYLDLYFSNYKYKYENISSYNIYDDGNVLYYLDDSTRKASLLLYYGESPTSFHVLSEISVNGKKYIVNGIKKYAFHKCSTLEELYIGKNIEIVEKDIIDNDAKTIIYCSHISKPYDFNYNWVSSNITVFWNYNSDLTVNGIRYEIEGDKAIVVSYVSNNLNLDICSSITYNGKEFPVTKIADNAFQSAKAESITIPNTITNIGKYAFAFNENLKSIILPNSVKSIGFNCFDSCKALSLVQLSDQLTSIPDGTFDGCISLQSINIPSSVTSIGGGAFRSCTSLKSIFIPITVKSIGSRVFEYCKITLYCEATSCPSGWSRYWNYDIFLNVDDNIIVKWGCSI